MNIRELLSQKRVTISCELFPPKQSEDLPFAAETVVRTVALLPDFISVTYGASGTTSKNTLQMTDFVKRCGGNALAHLTCVSSTKQQVHEILEKLQEQGIENVLALRGDIPQGHPFPEEQHFEYASDLVREIRKYGSFCIGAACYPEGHISSKSQAEDLRNLKTKVDAGCDFLTTQMFFDNNILYRFLYNIRELGIRVPVLAGIMPVTNKKQIARITKLSGATLPPRFLSILDKFGEDKRAMEQAGIAYATEQIIDLLANGINGIHIYTMNRPEIAGQIISNIKDIVSFLNRPSDKTE